MTPDQTQPEPVRLEYSTIYKHPDGFEVSGRELIRLVQRQKTKIVERRKAAGLVRGIITDGCKPLPEQPQTQR